jgi:type IV secretory pathway TrbL component
MGAGGTALQKMLDGLQGMLELSGQEVYGIVTAYLSLFALFALLWVLYQMAWGGHHLQSALGLCFRLMFVFFAVQFWPWFLGMLEQEGVWLGLLATGNRVQVVQFLDPGALVRMGIESGAVLWQAYDNNKGWKLFPVIGIAFFLAWLSYLCAFMVMAYKVFWWQVELLIMGLAGMVLLPSLVFRPTAFVASGVLNYAANAFARFFLGSLLAGLLWGVLPTLTDLALPMGQVRLATVDLKIQEAFYAVALAWTVAACFLAVNCMAGVLTSGVPGMAGGQSLGNLIHMMAGAGAAMATAGGAAVTTALGGARAMTAGGQALLGASSGAARALTTSQTLGQAAREIYGGARAGMQGGPQSHLGRLMGATSSMTQAAHQQTVRHLMQRGGGDTMMRGVRH